MSHEEDFTRAQADAQTAFDGVRTERDEANGKLGRIRGAFDVLKSELADVPAPAEASPSQPSPTGQRPATNPPPASPSQAEITSSDKASDADDSYKEFLKLSERGVPDELLAAALGVTVEELERFQLRLKQEQQVSDDRFADAHIKVTAKNSNDIADLRKKVDEIDKREPEAGWKKDAESDDHAASPVAAPPADDEHPLDGVGTEEAQAKKSSRLRRAAKWLWGAAKWLWDRRDGGPARKN